MHPARPSAQTTFHLSIIAVATVALAGCNQYSTPAIQSTTTTPGSASAVQNGASARSADPLNNQTDPSETTGSVGGAPGGTSSAQTEPSSSGGIR